MADERTPNLEIPSDIVCSICVANYNGMDIIDDCLQSILSQKGTISFEIIVHDDASSDGSADYISVNYPQVRLLRSSTNVGFCASNNRMAESARGRYLLLLNNDAALHHDALQTFLDEAMLLARPAVISLPQYDAASGKLIDRGLRLDPFLNPVPNLDKDLRIVATVHGACLWTPADLWRAIGGFPEWFVMIAEDTYFCSVARLRGANVVVARSSGYRHHTGHSIGGGKITSGRLATNIRRRAFSERNKNFLMMLSYPLSALIIIFPIHIVLLIMEGLILSIAKRKPSLLSQIYFPSLWALWKERYQLLLARRNINSQRIISARTFFSVFTFRPEKLRLLFRHGLPHIHS